MDTTHDVQISNLMKTGLTKRQIAESIEIPVKKVNVVMARLNRWKEANKKKMQPEKLTTAKTKELIKLFNSQEFSIREISEYMGISIYTVRSTVLRLQKQGVLNKKRRDGSFINNPTPEMPKAEQTVMEPALQQLMDEAELIETTNAISTYHKELLIEILHKVFS